MTAQQLRQVLAAHLKSRPQVREYNEWRDQNMQRFTNDSTAWAQERNRLLDAIAIAEGYA